MQEDHLPKKGHSLLQLNQVGHLYKSAFFIMNTLRDLLKFGNKKLPKTTAIFNMGPALDCPSDKLNLCQVSKICYAKKAERMYKSCGPYREHQKNYWLNITANEFASEFLEIVSHKKSVISALRLNESGDFWNQQCIDKAEKIATILQAHKIVVYGYSARKDLYFSNCKNLIVNGSSYSKPGVNNIFKPVINFSGGNLKCMADCKKCKLCTTKLNRIIEVIIH